MMRCRAQADEAVQELAIEPRLNALDGRLTGVESRRNFVQRQIGIVAALQIAALLKLFVR